MPWYEMNHPCTAPTPAPKASISSTTTGQGRPAPMAMAQTALISATCDPTDRSIPAVVMTMVMATATIRIGAA